MASSVGSESLVILAVDDNELNLSLFRLFLTQLGHNVVSSNDPIEAIEIAQHTSFDVIFTDIQMPNLSGLEAADAFRRNGFEGPVIAITAHLSEQEQQNLQSSAIDDVLIKPVTKLELTKTLSKWSSSSTVTMKVESEAPPYGEGSRVPDLIYDHELAESRAHHSPEIAKEMLELLIISLEETKAELKQCHGVEALRSLIHKALGGVRFTGAAKLEKALIEIQSRVHTTDVSVEVCVSDLLEEVEALESWFQSYSKDT